MNKLPKTPRITNKTKILCFDLETNGLHGEAFAAGAVLMDLDGQVHNSFTARSPIKGKVDEWVVKNVMPSIVEMPITHKNYKGLRQAFWEWYRDAVAESDYVLVENGYPVEYRFLLDCQEDDLQERYWQHPFPFIELSSLVLSLGGEYTKKRLEAEVVADLGPVRPHHPLDDARVTTLVAAAAFRKSGRLQG